MNYPNELLNVSFAFIGYPASRRIIARAYTGAGSTTIPTFPSDEESEGEGNQVNFRSAWRPGQPPRSDCVIKLTRENNKKVGKVVTC